LLDEVNLTDAPVVLHLIVLVFHAAHSPCLWLTICLHSFVTIELTSLLLHLFHFLTQLDPNLLLFSLNIIRVLICHLRCKLLVLLLTSVLL